MAEEVRPPNIFKPDATVPAPKAVELTPVELGSFLAEYVVRSPNLTIHLYRRHSDGYWAYEDAHIIWESMVKVFALQGRENQLTVEFVPELYSWCITIEKIAVITPPSHEKVVSALKEVDSRGVGTNARVDTQ